MHTPKKKDAAGRNFFPNHVAAAFPLVRLGLRLILGLGLGLGLGFNLTLTKSLKLNPNLLSYWECCGNMVRRKLFAAGARIRIPFFQEITPKSIHRSPTENSRICPIFQ